VSVQNQDIGFVREGQPVRLKLSTYPFQRYGMLEGVVKTVIADASTTPNAQNTQSSASNSSTTGQPLSFKAVIELSDQALKANGTHYPLAAGMQLAAEIVEGKRTVLQYLLSPVQRVTNEAGRER
jgi:hemolysin D